MLATPPHPTSSLANPVYTSVWVRQVHRLGFHASHYLLLGRACPAASVSRRPPPRTRRADRLVRLLSVLPGGYPAPCYQSDGRIQWCPGGEHHVQSTRLECKYGLCSLERQKEDEAMGNKCWRERYIASHANKWKHQRWELTKYKYLVLG